MIDIGANLAHESFDADRAAVLERAWSAGLEAIIITGSSMPGSARALELAREHPGRLFATAGLHPHHADEWSLACAAQIRRLAQDPQLVSLGECGLDYFRDLSPRAAQRLAFTAQLELAAELGKPLFLHQRNAHADFVAILREYRPLLGRVCVHCFTDTAQAASDYIDLDCHIGITGWICDERRGRHLLEIVPTIPSTRLLVETDAPYLLPRGLPKSRMPRDGRRNEPAYLPAVIETIARALGQSAAEVALTTTANARAFFNLGEPGSFSSGEKSQEPGLN
ncbi:MAG: TatD family hydrolase [Panacagrimonas sp.]